jgi:hypothetical protein
MLRRQALKNGLALLSAAGLAVAAYPAFASASGRAIHAGGRLHEKLAATLRSIDNAGCIAAAVRLEAAAGQGDVALQLRGVGLSAPAAATIADGLKALTDAEAASLTSLSLSYNAAIGDAGAAALARALPRRLPELGLVGCGIGDAGGTALLGWTRQATRLNMLCIEGNAFSEDLGERFRDLARTNPRLTVFV